MSKSNGKGTTNRAEDEDAERPAPAATTAADSTTSSTDVAHRKSKGGNKKKSTTNDTSAEGSADSTTPPPPSTSSNGKVSKRRKVNHACVYCRRSHMTCDDERPCTRCVKRNIGHLCHDELRDVKKIKTEKEHSAEEETSPQSHTSPNEMATNTSDGQDQPEESGSSLQTTSSMPPPRSIAPPTIIAPSPVSASQRANLNSNNQTFLGAPDWNSVSQQDWNPYHHPMMFSNPEAASEYNLMNEFFLDSIYNDSNMFLGENIFSDPSNFNAGASSNIFGSENSSGNNNNLNGNLAAPNAMLTAATAPSPMIRPTSVKPSLEKAKELYYLTAADPPKDGNSEERMKQVLKAKLDAGLLRPFNYINGYRRLQKYMDDNMTPSSKNRIQKALEKFRPTFRDRMHQLTDYDLIVVEEWFEKSLMEYDRVFAAMAVPACLWRRTGEIFRGNKEFAELIHVPIEQMRDGKLAIYELIAEESAVSYWEKFGAIAFDASQKAMLTTCYLKNPDPNSSEPLIHCCFSFTIRRDSASHIPAMIIGNFLPIPP